ncbi:MAG TPA: ionic transporter y4hA [Burkholderiaceae bacterium]|nr:ionic transporter y4hA [Burkholderiaceae bacterium]
MKTPSLLPIWTIAGPAIGWLLLAGQQLDLGSGYVMVLALGLVLCVLAAVHHAEVVAHRVGEPYGTLVLAGAVTVIEVALIVSLMLAGGSSTAGLARDTVFATVMIILNGIIGVCLLVGGTRFGEQRFGLYGVSASLATLAAIVVLTLVLPNYTTTAPGPMYSPSQLGFVAVVSLLLYGAFVFVQAIRHRDYFVLAQASGKEETHALMPTNRVTGVSALLLLACLGAVVLMAKATSPSVEAAIANAGAPKALVGIIIAAIVLLPEGLASLRAARANRLQTSLNLALGSALATIGLTIPAVAIVSITNGWTLMLGIDGKSTVLLLLTLFVATLSLGTGRTTVLQGAIHLVIFAVYLFTTVIP